MIKNITILGAGTMGHGMAEVFAMKGYDVVLYSRREESLEKAVSHIRDELAFLVENQYIPSETASMAQGKITTTTDLKEAVKEADFIIESLVEDIVIKQNIFADMEKYSKETCIFSTNTSSLALNKITEKMSPQGKARSMVCHWYNPAHLMPLVELSFFGNMNLETYKKVEDLFKTTDKRTAKVLKDVPGLAANRIQQGVAREVFSLMEQGIAEPEDIEIALKYGPAFRYATTGQLEVADMGGLDIWCTVGDNLLAVMENRQEASPLLREKVKEGKLGIKSGEGFFKYTEEDAKKKREDFNRRLIIQLKAAENYD